MKIKTYTLGCKVNQCESQAIAELFAVRGDTVLAPDSPEIPDVCIVNSCAVTAESEHKGRQLLHRLRREYPEAVLAVCGCMAQVSEKADSLCADVVVGTRGRAEIPRLVDAYIQDRQKLCRVGALEPQPTFEPLLPRSFETKTRAFLKIEDGCDRWCSYCIIPRARGGVRSMPPEMLQKEASLLAQSHSEIVLTGINLAAYGEDLGVTLADAADAAARAGAKRIRLGSVEADRLDETLLRRLAALPAFCPQFHLSLQSGSDAVLQRMHRRYDAAEYREMTRMIRALFDNPSLTTDVMVGFPQESEAEFEESLAFVREIGFSRLHVFVYSVRPQTLAATLPQVAPAIKKQRAGRMAAAGCELAEAFARSQVGTEAEVLFETGRDGLYTGWTRNYLSVTAASGDDLRHCIRRVRISAAHRECCTGVLI